MLLSARTESNQRCAKGCVSDERLRAAGVQSRPTPWTPITGDALLRIWHLRPAAPNHNILHPSCRGPLGPSSSQSPLYSGRPSVGIRHAAPLLLLSPPNPLRWALAGTPIKCLRCTNTAWPGITVAGGDSIQKGNEVSHKAFLPTFFSKKVGYSRRSTRWTWTQRFLSVSMVKRQALILQGPSASS